MTLISSLQGSFLLFSRSNLYVPIPPARRCEVPSCYPHEAISVSLSRLCEVTSCYPHEAISMSLLPSPSLRGPSLESPPEAISVSLIPSLRGHFLLSSRSNLRATTPLPVVARFLILNSPRSNLRVTYPVVARSLLAILTKQSPCHLKNPRKSAQSASSKYL